MSQKIWLITGISSGFGKALADEVIDAGDFVIGTFRDPIQVDAFNNKHKDESLALLVDITKAQDVQKAFQHIENKIGRIDVLVNNAGLGFGGAVEEASNEEIRSVFEVNFFGALRITQTALPIFRRQKSGHIVQISSHGGFKATPGFGIYNASKFALEGFSEALAAEIATLGIKLTIVEPGPFRTNFAGSSFRHARKRIPDYDPTAGIFREKIKLVNGKQEGDPIKAARAIIKIVNSENPPLRLPLGRIAIATILSKLESVQNDLSKFREIAESTVY